MHKLNYHKHTAHKQKHFGGYEMYNYNTHHDYLRNNGKTKKEGSKANNKDEKLFAFPQVCWILINQISDNTFHHAKLKTGLEYSKMIS